jgi:hypothetical protein
LLNRNKHRAKSHIRISVSSFPLYSSSVHCPILVGSLDGGEKFAKKCM